MWEVRYSRDGYSIEIGEQKGREPPEWFLNKPELDDWDYYYLNAFSMLTTTRRYEMAPIPWDAIISYAKREQLDEAVTDALVNIIMAMDSGYLEWQDKNRKKS